MPPIPHRLRLLTAVALSVASALLIGSSAHADTPRSADCPDRPIERPFTQWGDTAPYVMVPGGHFESGAAGWSLTDGATVSPGNEPFYVHGAGDESSLALPSGSSATSPEMCIGFEYPTLRFFASRTGSETSRLAVWALFRTPDGVARRLQIAELDAGETLIPTRRILLLANVLGLHPDWDGQVAFRFSPTGSGAQWRVDDVYVDPYER